MRCAYCGCWHTHSEAMCRDALAKSMVRYDPPPLTLQVVPDLESRERIARIDATASRLLAESFGAIDGRSDLRDCYKAGVYDDQLASECDAAYRFAAALELARARFVGGGGGK